MTVTHQLFVEPAAIVIDLADDVFDLCNDVLSENRLKVHKVAHAAAACERIATLLPRLVVVHVTMAAADLDAVEDRAVAVGASLLYLDTTEGADSVRLQLHEAAADVRAKFAGRSP